MASQTTTMQNLPTPDALDDAMSLRELRDRLSAIIAENERRGWSERNSKPMVLRVSSRTASGRLRDGSAYIPVVRACSSLLGIPTADGSRADVISLETTTQGK